MSSSASLDHDILEQVFQSAEVNYKTNQIKARTRASQEGACNLLILFGIGLRSPGPLIGRESH